MARYLGPSAPWLDFRETTFAEYAAGYPPTSVNLAMLVGHNTLRLMAMGMENRPPEAAELDHMRGLLEEALAGGAIGLSSGLFTAPGSYAKGQELVELGQVLKRHGGRYFTHLRDESNDVFNAFAEAAEFGARTGVHVQVVHMKLSGTDNWGGAGRLLEALAAARRRGIAIDCDAYPYTAASNPLVNLLPGWLQEGGVDVMLERLGREDIRAPPGSARRGPTASITLGASRHGTRCASPSRPTCQRTPGAPSPTWRAKGAPIPSPPPSTTSWPTAARPGSW